MKLFDMVVPNTNTEHWSDDNTVVTADSPNTNMNWDKIGLSTAVRASSVEINKGKVGNNSKCGCFTTITFHILTEAIMFVQE